MQYQQLAIKNTKLDIYSKQIFFYLNKQKDIDNIIESSVHSENFWLFFLNHIRGFRLQSFQYFDLL